MPEITLLGKVASWLLCESYWGFCINRWLQRDVWGDAGRVGGVGWDKKGAGGEVCGTKKDPLFSVSLRLKQLAPTFCFSFLLTLGKKRKKKHANTFRGTHTHVHAHTHTYTHTVGNWRKAKVRQLWKHCFSVSEETWEEIWCNFLQLSACQGE